MRKKIFDVLNKIYGIMMTISFFGGLLPLPVFLFSIIVGGQMGETLTTFFHKQYYPWVIMIGSVAIVFGLIAMYIGKLEGLSVKSVNADKNKEK